MLGRAHNWSLPFATCRLSSTQSDWSLHLYCALCVGRCCTCPPHTSSWDHQAGTPTPGSQRKRSQEPPAQLMARRDRPDLRQVWMRSAKSTLLHGPGVWDSSGVLPPTLARGNIPWGWKHGATYPPQKHLLPLTWTCPFEHAALTLHFSFFFFVIRSGWFLHPPEKGEDMQVRWTGWPATAETGQLWLSVNKFQIFLNNTCKKHCRFGQIHPRPDTSIQLCVMLASSFIMLSSSKITF